MNKTEKVAICSRSLSKNAHLRSIILDRYSQVKFNDEGLSLDGKELISYIQDSDKIIIGLEQVTKSVLDACPNLKVISKYGVGLDNIDLEEVKRRGIKLGWKGGINKRSVSEMTLSLILNLMRKVHEGITEVKSGGWGQIKGNLLSNKTVGILGFGNIGRDLAILLKPFGCNILAYDLIELDVKSIDYKQVTLDEIMQSSDVISIHLPFTESTKDLIDLAKLSLMKETSILVNLSRGGIVVENDLKKALQNNIISGAAMDVFKSEPPNDADLIALKNFLATPHMGGVSVEGMIDMGLSAIDGLDGNFVTL